MHDFYCYPDTNVLINKFNIRDDEKLDEVERNITAVKLSLPNEIEKIFEKGFDYNSLKNLHKFIFGDIYAWAGQEREIEVIKHEKVLGGLSVTYSYPTEIEKDVNNCIEKLQKNDWQKLNLNDRAEQFAKNIAELWQAHPFREGNTRTVITFACEFADKHGFPMDRELLSENAGYTRNALVMASIGQYSEYQYLTRIFTDSMERGSNAQLKNCSEQLNPNENLKQETVTIPKEEYDSLINSNIQKKNVIDTTNQILNENPELKEAFTVAKRKYLSKNNTLNNQKNNHNSYYGNRGEQNPPNTNISNKKSSPQKGQPSGKGTLNGYSKK